MTGDGFSELVQSQDNSEAPGGRGEYYLKRPNEFFSADKVGERAEETTLTDMSQPGGADMHNAAAILSHLLPKPGGQQAPLQRPSSLPYKDQECQEFVPTVNYIDHEVLIANQPYRTTPLVLPHAKTIHDGGEMNKNIISTTKKEPQGSQPFRNSSLVMAAPRTINETGVGAGPYRPYRGPQYFADRKPVDKAQAVYNSPVHLYSQDTLEQEADNPSHTQVIHSTPPPAKEPSITRSLESATQQMVLQSEQSGQDSGARPDSQLSNTSDRWRHVQDPVMKDSTINQSASFKKLMYSVMGDSDF